MVYSNKKHRLFYISFQIAQLTILVGLTKKHHRMNDFRFEIAKQAIIRPTKVDIAPSKDSNRLGS